METCIRGFSFMPENLETVGLKLVDSEVLEQTWKTSRRERVKQQEQKIWEEFVEEKDVVSNIYKEDPYQFIEHLSEEKIKELLEIELEKMRKEKLEEEEQCQGISTKKETVELKDNQHVIFVDEAEREDDTFHIFDDEKEGDVSGVSGPEDELLNDSLSPPCTVRERLSPDLDTRNRSPDKVSSTKSSENVTSMIESSIYCARVKDLRGKIASELEEIALSLERQNILNIDPSALPKMMQRSVEFTSRFNRIHMYQLQRQVQDIKRNNSQALPFAKHTQFQSQMVRIVSLHQNVLHSLQVFIKSFPQTLCIRESGELLKSLLQMIKEILDTCEQVDTPANLNAAKDLFQDSLPHSTDKLLNAIEDYTSRMSEYLNSTENTSVSCSRHSKRSRGRKLSGTWSKSGSKSFGDTEAHLSMYSLDTLRNHSTAKMSSSKGHSGGTSKKRGSLSGRSKASADRSVHAAKRKKSPRSRRPLMRDPQAGVPKPKRKTDKDLDVPTLVETVAPCTSSHMSREASPGPTPILKQIISKKGKDTSPRSPKKETKRLRKETKTPRKISKSPKGSKSTGKEAIALDKELGEDEQIQKQDAATPRRDTPKKGTPRTEAVTTRDRSSSPRKEPEVIIAKKQVTPRNDCPTPRKRTSRSEGIPWQEQKPIVGEQKPTPQTISSRKTTPRYMSLGEGENAYEKEIVDVSPGRESRRVRDRRASEMVGGCEVMNLLRQLCGGDSAGNRNERVSGTKNAQLVCVSGGSPRQPSTPQLLRILEETIQKKTPRPHYTTPRSPQNIDKCRMTFNIPESISEQLYQYRTKFVQHMLTSSMYANSAVGKPWEVIGRVSENLIDELLLSCAKEMELQRHVRELYKQETS